MSVGKTFSFTTDEANVDDLVKACELQQNLFCLVRILTLCHYKIIAYLFTLALNPIKQL